MMEDVEAKRASPRIDVSLRTFVQSDINVDLSDSFMSNLSQGGCFVRTKQPLAVGSPIALKVELPCIMASISAVGVVRWVKDLSHGEDAGMGVQFQEVSERDLNLLKQFIERQLMNDLFA